MGLRLSQSARHFLYTSLVVSFLHLQAIEGFGTLRLGKWQQMMVPIKEMTDVMKVVKEVVSVKPKQWVRLKRGIYKDDLAQVTHFNHKHQISPCSLVCFIATEIYARILQ